MWKRAALIKLWKHMNKNKKWIKFKNCIAAITKLSTILPRSTATARVVSAASCTAYASRQAVPAPQAYANAWAVSTTTQKTQLLPVTCRNEPYLKRCARAAIVGGTTAGRITASAMVAAWCATRNCATASPATTTRARLPCLRTRPRAQSPRSAGSKRRPKSSRISSPHRKWSDSPLCYE